MDSQSSATPSCATCPRTAQTSTLLRKAAARTIEALIAAIAEALTKVIPQECENYLANQGYRRQL
jgi:hypothetical protein